MDLCYSNLSTTFPIPYRPVSRSTPYHCSTGSGYWTLPPLRYPLSRMNFGALGIICAGSSATLANNPPTSAKSRDTGSRTMSNPRTVWIVMRVLIALTVPREQERPTGQGEDVFEAESLDIWGSYRNVAVKAATPESLMNWIPVMSKGHHGWRWVTALWLLPRAGAS